MSVKLLKNIMTSILWTRILVLNFYRRLSHQFFNTPCWIILFIESKPNCSYISRCLLGWWLYNCKSHLISHFLDLFSLPILTRLLCLLYTAHPPNKILHLNEYRLKPYGSYISRCLLGWWLYKCKSHLDIPYPWASKFWKNHSMLLDLKGIHTVVYTQRPVSGLVRHRFPNSCLTPCKIMILVLNHTFRQSGM